MTSYKEIVRNKTEFLALTGYTKEEFEALLPHFERYFEAYISEYTLEGKRRKRRAYVPYRNSPLPTIEDKLVFILNYFKTNNLQSVQARLFGMHQAEANMWIHLLTPLVNQALAACGELPARDVEELDIDEEDVFLFQDGTERPIQRPQDSTEQRDYYVLTNLSCHILYLSPTVAGKIHDKKLADQTLYTLPEGTILSQDTGFQGFSLDNVTILQPKKKPYKAELSEAEKEANSLISRFRICVEHAIGGVKRYRIVKDRIRTYKKGFRDLVLETCCGLHNFRLRFRPWAHHLPHHSILQSL